jgi:hypothetical protein
LAPGFAVGKRHIADMNQKIAEPHAATMIPVSMYDFIITPHIRATAAAITPPIRTIPRACSLSAHDGFGDRRFWHFSDMPSDLANVIFRE